MQAKHLLNGIRNNIINLRANLLLRNFIHVLVLNSFAVSQPLFGLLAKQTEFFVVRQSTRDEIIVFILIAVLLVPIALMIFEIILGFLWVRALSILHYFFVGAFIAVIFHPMLKHVEIFPSYIDISISLTAGVIFVFFYARRRIIRVYLLWLTPAIIIFPAIFIAAGGIREIIFPESEEIATTTKRYDQRNLPPIVILVFDAFPLVSMLNADLEIDGFKFPNFDSFSRDAIWFRNATTASTITHRAIPSILTGRRPNSHDFLPNVSHNPVNIFTILDGQYEFRVFESMGRLCPNRICDDYRMRAGFSLRAISLAADLTVVYLHVVFPEVVARELPDVTRNWSGFGLFAKLDRGVRDDVDWVGLNLALRSSRRDLLDVFRKFLNSIPPRETATLYFHHIVLPHQPFKYYPSGKQYQRRDKAYSDGLVQRGGAKWGRNQILVDLNYQRHLLQAQFADRLVGDLIQRLKDKEMYEESLIVVTADHGESYRVRSQLRSIDSRSDNYRELLPVPLLIKFPGQESGGVIEERNVESIDIVPTILDAIGFAGTWEFDGDSVINPRYPERDVKIAYSAGKVYAFGAYIDLTDLVRYKISRFGAGPNLRGMYGLGPLGKLVGEKVGSFIQETDESLVVQVKDIDNFRHVNLSSSWVPGQIVGRIIDSNSPAMVRNIGIGLNGKIVASTQTYGWEGENGLFDVILPEKAFRNGENQLEIFVIKDIEDGQATLIRVEMPEMNPNLARDR